MNKELQTNYQIDELKLVATKMNMFYLALKKGFTIESNVSMIGPKTKTEHVIRIKR